MIRRVRPFHVFAMPPHPFWNDGEPYVWDCRIIDIGNTVAAAIKNAPAGLVALSARPEMGESARRLAERAARKRCARIIWLPISKLKPKLGELV